MFLSFGLIQGAQVFLPLLALPWLARVLGNEAFGLLMYMCLLPPIIGLVLDWGLMAGGARATAVSQEEPQKRAEVLGEVLAARLNLAFLCFFGCLVALPLVPHAARHPVAWGLAFLAGIARGSSPVWFFQGTGRGMPKMAAVDALSSLLVLILTVCLVHYPRDWPLYLLFLALCKGAAYFYLTLGLAREYKIRLHARAGVGAIWKTKTLFAGPLSLTICNNGTQMIMGYWLSAAQSGLISACHKMFRALAGTVNPLVQTLYPQACRKAHSNRDGMRAMFLFALGTSLAFMLPATALAYYLAPWLIELAMGENYLSAVPVLRAMLFAAPVMACNQIIVTQAILPRRLEKIQARAQGGVAILSLPLAAILGATTGLEGCAWLPFILELSTCAALCHGLWRDGTGTVRDGMA